MRRVIPLLLLLVMAAGLAGGLFYTWVVDPIEYYDSAPEALRFEDKFTYLTLVGDLYAYGGDLAWAQARLADLGVGADGTALADLIEQHLDAGGRPEGVRNLARLAQDLGASGGVLAVFAQASPSRPEATSLATVSPAPDLTLTPSPTLTPAPRFDLVEQTALCAAAGSPGQIAVWVQDARGNPLPGVEIVVSWATGQDRFFTGLRPEQGAGYADFDMASQIEYDVSLSGYGGQTAQGIRADLAPGLCQAGVEAQDWRLVFQQTQ